MSHLLYGFSPRWTRSAAGFFLTFRFADKEIHLLPLLTYGLMADSDRLVFTG